MIYKALNISIISAFTLALVLLTVLFFKPFVGLNFFPWLTFLLLTGWSLLISTVFLRSNRMHIVIRGSIVFLCMLPVLIHAVGLLQSETLLHSWPLLFSLIIFQVMMGKLALLNFFRKNVAKSLFTIITSLFVVIIYLAIMVIYLLKISLPEVHGYIIGAVSFTSLCFFLALITEKRQRPQLN